MADATRIDVQEARRRVSERQALRVCAYADEAKRDRLRLEGATSLQRLEAQLPRNTESIFYCARPAEATSVGQAEKYRAGGFTRSKALKGGVEAPQQAGYPMAA